MSIEDELLRLARQRESATEDALAAMVLDRPDLLRRQLREYLFRQFDRHRIKRPDERIPQLATVQGGVNELACPELEFSSGGRLAFDIQLEEEQRGWLVKRFRFHVHLPQPRRINMVRIHLNAEAWHDPLASRSALPPAHRQQPGPRSVPSHGPTADLTSHLRAYRA